MHVLLQRLVRHLDRLQSRFILVGVVTCTNIHLAAIDTDGNMHNPNENRRSLSQLVQRNRSTVSVLFFPQPLPIHISCYPLAMRLWLGAHPIHIHYNHEENTHHYLPYHA